MLPVPVAAVLLIADNAALDQLNAVPETLLAGV